MTLLTARLTLRDFTHDDAAFVLALLNEPAFIANIGDREVRTLDAARAWVDNGPAASYARHGYGVWRVGLRADDRPIGMCGLLKRDTLAVPDLGFAFLSEHWGAGYAREAALAVTDHARTVLGLTRLAAIVLPGNTRSLHLLAQLGFVRTGVVRLMPEEPDLALLVSDRRGGDPSGLAPPSGPGLSR